MSNKLVYCPSCRNEISTSAVVCPKCGRQITSQEMPELIKEREKSDKWVKIAVGIFTAFLFYFIFSINSK